MTLADHCAAWRLKEKRSSFLRHKSEKEKNDTQKKGLTGHACLASGLLQASDDFPPLFPFGEGFLVYYDFYDTYIIPRERISVEFSYSFLHLKLTSSM